MKFRGGYNVSLPGKPSSQVRVLPEVDTLCLPLRSPRFEFSEIGVSEGERVQPGRALARDPGNHSVPLLAPRAGTVRLGAAEGHIILEDVHKKPEDPYRPEEQLAHAPKDMDSAGKRRYKLLALGAWQFFRDAHTDELPDPFGVPDAVVVTTLMLEPFAARGDVQIRKRLSSFTRGLEHLQSFLEYQPIYLVLPDIGSPLARRMRETLRGYAWVQMVKVPLRYGLDSFAVLARSLNLKRSAGAVWALDAAGVLAVDRALTHSLPSTVRIVSVGGPAAKEPCHLKATPGYPLRDILDAYGGEGPARTLSGGVFRGEAVCDGQLGLDTECSGVTLLP